MIWKKGPTGKILKRPGTGIVLTDTCCCVLACCDCVDLSGYEGDLKCTISGAMSGCTNLTRGLPVDECPVWVNPGTVTPIEEDPCADFIFALDVRLVCKEGQPPKLIVGHSDDATCNLSPRDTELEAGTLDCTVDNFSFVRTVDIVGGGCGCSPMSLTFTIEKGTC